MLREIRKQYEIASLNESDTEKSPVIQFSKLIDDALRRTETEPTAMVISTVHEQLQPHSMVLLFKELDESELVFYTNYERNKGHK